MNFPTFDFAQLGEPDVREEIIAPLLKHLGYRAGTDWNIIREQSLRYPRVYIGTKKQGKDPLLRGEADYICDVEKKIRWVVEAKSPDVELGLDQIEQAYSYANHPEVRAVYFCVTNGRKFEVYQTNHGPEAKPLLSLKFEELNQSIQLIENLLSPASLLRDHPEQQLDIGIPIGSGLRSIVRITGGHIVFRRSNPDVPPLNGLITTITEGAVERDEQGRLVAFLRTIVPFQSMQSFNERLGLSNFETMSESDVLSTDPSRPTVFTAHKRTILPRGERVLNLLTWQESPLPIDIDISTQTTASGVLYGNKFRGMFNVMYTTAVWTLTGAGDFEVSLA
jgi:hypothetical protein